MPRLTWDRANSKEVATAREAFEMYTKRRFVARHNGQLVKVFNADHQVLVFELGPSAYDRVMKEEDPWES